MTYLTNTAGGATSMLPMILMLGALIIFWVFMSRRQKKQEKEAADMRNNVQVGDEITTIGGIIGKVVSVKDETLVLETTRDCTKIRILKTAVRSIDVHAEDTQDSGSKNVKN